jgi:myo-inositol-1(or 4)-monophosphatase
MSHCDPQDLLTTLAQRIRKRIYPLLNSEPARLIEGIAHSGDVTFQIDVTAEQELESYLAQAEFKLAYYTEDKGLIKKAPSPDWLLIIDPIDGIRPAFSGFESSVVSIALYPYSDHATFKDITHGIILELKSGNLFYAESGNGVLIQSSDPMLSKNPSRNEDLELMRWSFEIAGRPVKQIIKKLGPLIDISSFKGGVYIFNCSAYALARLVTGQLDAYIDLAAGIVDDGNEDTQLPRVSTHGLFTYDIAAAFLMTKESNCVITYSWGNLLDNKYLVSKDLLSGVATSNLGLHQKLINWLNKN